MKQPILEYMNVSLKYKKDTVLEDINLKMFKNESILLLGRNGAGKSTLLKSITGILTPTYGNIIKDTNLLTGGYINNPYYIENLTGRENIYYFSTIEKEKIKERIEPILEDFNMLTDIDKKCSEYSAGMLKKLAIIHSLVVDTDVIILDEPTNALDPVGIIRLQENIMTIRKKYKKLIVISSHIISETISLCDRALIINNKRIVLDSAIKTEDSQKEIKEKFINACS